MFAALPDGLVGQTNLEPRNRSIDEISSDDRGGKGPEQGVVVSFESRDDKAPKALSSPKRLVEPFVGRAHV